MKKVTQTIAVIAIVLSPFALGSNALAASTCQVGYTGPDSNNLCVSKTTYKCNVVNNTFIDIIGQNTQIAISGDGSGGGSATSGSATNENGVTFTATIENEDCTAIATVPATEVTPPVGGAGAAAAAPMVTPPVAGAGAAVAALPNTDSASPLMVAAIVTTVLGMGAILARLVVSAYVRIKS